MNGVFGIPYPILGFFGFLLAGLFSIYWPKPAKNARRGMWRNMGLHYLHPLGWLLLGMAGFIQNRNIPAAIATAILGVVALIGFFALLLLGQDE